MTDETLRVGVDLLWLVTGVVGGTEDAAIGIFGALADAHVQGIETTLYAQPTFVRAHPTLASELTTRTCSLPSGARSVRVAAESTWLPWRAHRDRLDVLHCYGGTVPPGVRVPTVLTLHDIQPLEPGAQVSPVKRRWLSTMIPRSVEAAEVVLVPSAFVRDRLIDRLGTPPAKIAVHPHGVGPVVSEELGAEREAALRARFRIPGAFVLYPAITYPHKNHEVLIDAFARLHRTRTDVTLVLTGGAGPAEQEVVLAVERAGVGGSVRRVGRIEDDVLAELFRLADVVAYPSRYEGFGLPALQAMRVGTPIVAARAASLPEVVGDAGQLVDPDDVDAWQAALALALDGGPVVQEMVRLGAVRARSHSWDRLVPMLVAAYRRAATRGEVPGA